MSTSRDASRLREVILTAKGDKPADLVIKNARIVNTFTSEIITADVAVAGDTIAGIGSYSGPNELDASDKYLTPGLVDSHMHLESSLLSPAEFSRAVIPHGTTTVVIDPHEIANVAGVQGIIELLAASENLPVTFYVMVPCCVPASRLSTSGAKINADDIQKLYEHERVLGLAEVMDFPGVLNADPEVLSRIAASRGKIIDGHAPDLSGNKLQAYCAAGITSDHETTMSSEGLEKLRAGMYLILRQGSAARNLRDLAQLVTPSTERRCLLATDDILPADIARFGHIDHLLRMLVRSGVNSITAIRMATLNAAERLQIPYTGAIAPGYKADLVIMEDLESFETSVVISSGRVVYRDKELTVEPRHHQFPKHFVDSIHVSGFNASRLKIPVEGEVCRVITALDGRLTTGSIDVVPAVLSGHVVADIDRDILKIAVIERHKDTGNVGVGLIHGFGLKKGALAGSVAHDSHNIIVVGTSDMDMALAVDEVIKMSGGLVVIGEGRVIASLPLPLAGLMTDLPYSDIVPELERLESAARTLGTNMVHPFMTLSFMTLEVIPELKISDRGLVDVKKESFVGLFTSSDFTRSASASLG